MQKDVYTERRVTHHLVEKDQDALYRLETYAKTAIEGMGDPWPGAQYAMESKALHIEHGILLLVPSLIDIPFDIASFCDFILLFPFDHTLHVMLTYNIHKNLYKQNLQ